MDEKFSIFMGTADVSYRSVVNPANYLCSGLQAG